MRKIQLSIGLQPDQYEDLKNQATVEDVSIAHVVRRIIKEAGVGKCPDVERS